MTPTPSIAVSLLAPNLLWSPKSMGGTPQSGLYKEDPPKGSRKCTVLVCLRVAKR